MKTKGITVQLKIDQFDELDKYCKKTQQSKAAVVRRLLREHLAKQGKEAGNEKA